jgi:hypothetical protein
MQKDSERAMPQKHRQTEKELAQQSKMMKRATKRKGKESVEEKEAGSEVEIATTQPRSEIDQRFSYIGRGSSEGEAPELTRKLSDLVDAWNKRKGRLQRRMDAGHILMRGLSRGLWRKSRYTHRIPPGIGVHHAGLPTQYRQAVEWMFRVKRVQVVFATGTLALGTFPLSLRALTLRRDPHAM